MCCYGVRDVLYDIIADFEKNERRAPYHIEIAMIYANDKAWFSPFQMLRIIYVMFIIDMAWDDILYTCP